MERILKFPEGFLWGSATSAYQVEGGIENNDWAKFYPAGRASDHYNLYEKDFDLIKQLNQNAYRFSIEWSRVEPKEGLFSQKEIEHYRKFLLALKKRGIKTMATLHHFTIPWWLAEKGGWANKRAIFYFSRFAERIFNQYRDLVDFWITVNEPLIYASKSYLEGVWPPQGSQTSPGKNLFLFLKVIQNQIRAHKKIYEIFHLSSRRNILVGIAKNNIFFEPASPFFLNRFSAKTANYFWNKYFLNKIKNHLDFIGLNYYFHNRIKFPFLRRNENKEVSDIGWEIYPQGIYYVLKGLKDYGLPIYITENGLADTQDRQRKDFIKKHLFWTSKAIEEGADVRGYFHWSLLDNFEWEKGFEPRFGLVGVDYKTMARKPRPSALYYAQICKNNGF